MHSNKQHYNYYIKNDNYNNSYNNCFEYNDFELTTTNDWGQFIYLDIECNLRKKNIIPIYLSKKYNIYNNNNNKKSIHILPIIHEENVVNKMTKLKKITKNQNVNDVKIIIHYSLIVRCRVCLFIFIIFNY